MSPDVTPGQRMVGRGAVVNPPNRFERTQSAPDWEHLEGDDSLTEPRAVPTEFLPDETKSLIVQTDSPDIPFRYSINPYRGCEHGCAYCYARPYHEMLGMNAGLDFETKILVKFDAARVLRKELGLGSWQGEPVCLSGVTDCYQRAERLHLRRPHGGHGSVRREHPGHVSGVRQEIQPGRPPARIRHVAVPSAAQRKGPIAAVLKAALPRPASETWILSSKLSAATGRVRMLAIPDFHSQQGAYHESPL